MRTDARIFCGTNWFVVDIPESRKEMIMKHLQDGRTAGKVAIRDLSTDYTLLSIQGPHAKRLIEDAAPTSGPSYSTTPLIYKLGLAVTASDLSE